MGIQLTFLEGCVPDHDPGGPGPGLGRHGLDPCHFLRLHFGLDCHRNPARAHHSRPAHGCHNLRGSGFCHSRDPGPGRGPDLGRRGGPLCDRASGSGCTGSSHNKFYCWRRAALILREATQRGQNKWMNCMINACTHAALFSKQLAKG